MFTQKKSRLTAAILAAAASVSLVGFSLTSQADEITSSKTTINTSGNNSANMVDNNTLANSTPLTVPNGFQQKKLESESAIKTGLVKLTDRAVTKGDFNSYLAEFAAQDKARAREFKGADQKKLDDVIASIQTAWKAKYNQSFAVNDKNVVFGSEYAILQGEVLDPNIAIDNWPVQPVPLNTLNLNDKNPAQMNGAAMPVNNSTADRTPIESNGKTNDQDRQISLAKLTKGRDVALVRMPGRSNEPGLTVSMIFQFPDFWRIDVPNNRAGADIYNDLYAHLDYINQHQSQWPADVSEAYRMVAYHAAAAAYGVKLPSGLASAR